MRLSSWLSVESDLKVLLNTHCVTRGDGQGRVNYEIAAYLAGAGHAVTLLADRVAPELLEHSQITWQRIPAPIRMPDLPRCLLWAEACTSYLRTHAAEFDIVHLNGALAYVPHHVNTSHFVHSSFRTYLQEEHAPGWRGLYHRLHAEVNARLERKVYRLAQRVVAVSPKTGRELEQSGVSTQQLQVICNGVDSTEFYPSTEARQRMRATLGIPADQMALLYVGDFTQTRKGLSTVLAAMAGLPEHIHLYVAGKGTVSTYRSLLGPVEKQVHFLGFRRDIAELFRAVDLFVFPSRYDSMPLVVLEALASGLPVVTTRASGFGELMGQDSEGIVIEDPYDAMAVHSALLRLYDQAGLREQMGRQARRLAETYSWQKMARQYEALYEATLTETKR